VFTEVEPGAPEIDARHPLKKVPVASHGALHLAESRAICEYIDTAFGGPPLMPREAGARARAEQWVSMVTTDLDPIAVRKYLFAYIFPRGPGGAPDRDTIEQCLPAVQERLSVWNALLAHEQPFAAGSAYSLVDAYVTPILAYLARMPETAAFFEGAEPIRAYLQRMSARPSFGATRPEMLGA
jgi:glutathione S-transferase